MKHKILMEILQPDGFVTIFLDGKEYGFTCEYPSELAYSIKDIMDIIDNKDFEMEIKEVDYFIEDDENNED